jgi:hypothetical protein
MTPAVTDTTGVWSTSPVDKGIGLPAKSGVRCYWADPAHINVTVPNFAMPTASMTLTAWVWANSTPRWAAIAANWNGAWVLGEAYAVLGISVMAVFGVFNVVLRPTDVPALPMGAKQERSNAEINSSKLRKRRREPDHGLQESPWLNCRPAWVVKPRERSSTTDNMSTMKPLLAGTAILGVCAAAAVLNSIKAAHASVAPPTKAIVLRGVTVTPGVRLAELTNALQKEFILDAGMPDIDWGRFSIICRPKGGPRPEEPVFIRELKGPGKQGAPKEKRIESGGLLYDRQGIVTRAWKSYAEFDNEQARGLAYELVKAFESLANENYREVQIRVKNGARDNTTITFDVGGKAVELVVYDSPGGARTVHITEISRTD